MLRGKRNFFPSSDKRTERAYQFARRGNLPCIIIHYRRFRTTAKTLVLLVLVETAHSSLHLCHMRRGRWQTAPLSQIRLKQASCFFGKRCFVSSCHGRLEISILRRVGHIVQQILHIGQLGRKLRLHGGIRPKILYRECLLPQLFQYRIGRGSVKP